MKISRRRFLGSFATAMPYLLPSDSAWAPPFNKQDRGVSRPFYATAHDTNTIALVESALTMGANAIEIDVNVFKSQRSQLCVGHGPELHTGPASNNSPPLSDYLAEVAVLARRYRSLALIYLDCKPLTATAEHFRAIVESLRGTLETTVTNPPTTIISVASLSERGMFSDLSNLPLENEGLMVDQDNDPAAVTHFFTHLGVSSQGYGDGISFANKLSWLFAPSVKRAIAKALAEKEREKLPQLVFTWTVNSTSLVARYAKMGVDGIIADVSPPWYNPGGGLSDLLEIISDSGSQIGIRLATREDAPFARRQAA